MLYRGAVAARNGLYRRGRLAVHRVDAPVVSVGNLTVGGSGKTPFVAYLAARLRERGRRVAVVSRGYGGSGSATTQTVSDGSGPLLGPEVAGDEPVLLASMLPSVAVVIGRDRVAAALHARRRLGADLILLDDGFQHRRLHRDLDLLLIDAGTGLGNGRMLPFGPLREPAVEVARADALILTGTAAELPAAAARARESAGLPGGAARPIFRCERRVEGFRRAEGEEDLSPAALKGLRLFPFSGIARPESFEADLRDLGVSLAGGLRFPDHQPFGPAQVREIESVARRAGAELLVTTDKDRVRLGGARLALPLITLRIRMVPQDEEELLGFLDRRLFPASAGTAGRED